MTLEQPRNATAAPSYHWNDRGLVRVLDRRSNAGRWLIELALTPEESERLAEITGSHIGHSLATVVDDVVVYAGKLQAPIQDSIRISNRRQGWEAEELAIMLRSGPLPVSLKVVPQGFPPVDE